MTYLRAHLAMYRKALVALTGALGQAVTLGMLHGRAQNIAQLVLAALTALGVYGVANAVSPAYDDAEAGEGEITMLLRVATFLLVLALALGWLPR